SARQVLAVCDYAHLAPADCHLLDCYLMVGYRTLRRPGRERIRAQIPTARRQCAVRCTCPRCWWIARWRVVWHPAETRQSLVLVRKPGVRVRRPGTLLADPALRRSCPVALSHG